MPPSAEASAEDRDRASLPDGSRSTRIATASLGGLLGGLIGGAVVLAVTVALKSLMDLVSAEATVEVIVVPLLGLALTTLVLHVAGRTASPDSPCTSAWRTFPPDAIRADITGDVVDSAGVEERFPWRLAPVRPALRPASPAVTACRSPRWRCRSGSAVRARRR